MNIKIVIGLVVLLLVVVFVVQNAIAVEIHFLFWKLSMSRSIMIFFFLIIGFVFGWITGNHFHNKKQA